MPEAQMDVRVVSSNAQMDVRVVSVLGLTKQSRWPQYYNVLETELGNTGTLLDFGNEKTAGLVSASTWTGRKFHASILAKYTTAGGVTLVPRVMVI